MHVCEVCGNDFPLGRVYERCGLKVCHHCCDSERWCPTVTIYPTTVQAWRDMPAEDDVFALPV